jgi:hypothetical protein
MIEDKEDWLLFYRWILSSIDGKYGALNQAIESGAIRGTAAPEEWGNMLHHDGKQMLLNNNNIALSTVENILCNKCTAE